MGIRAGSGRGSADIGGSKGNVPGGVGSSRKRDKRLPIQPPPKKPLKPVESPFPQKPDFRLGQYRVIEEKDDYLLCTGFDPNAKNPFSEVTPSAFRSGSLMKVAKPPALQRTAWEAGPVTIGGVEYTYEYSNTEKGLRTATWNEDDLDHEEEQRIDIPYVVEGVGDVIVAVQIRKSAAVDGMEFTDEAGTRLRWMDLNVSGRHWKGAGESEETHPPIVGQLQGDLSGGGSATVEVVVGGSGTETVYERLGLGDNDPLPADTHVAAVYMNGLGYVVIGAGCQA